MIKKTLFVLITILFTLFQISFISQFASLALYCNCVLILTVLISTLGNFKLGFAFAIISGFVLDLYSSFNFGIITVSLLSSIIIMYYLFRKLLARKSVYSIILVMAISTIAYHLIFLATTNIMFWFNWSDIVSVINKQYANIIIIQLVVHSLLIASVYWIIHLVNRKIRSRFIIGEHI
jgi:hypothetical protein